MFIENNDLYFTFRIVVITMSTLGMMCSTTEFKYSSKKVAHIFSLYALYVLLSTGALVYFFGYLVFLRVSLITISFPGILLSYRLSTNGPARALFNSLTQILFSLYCCLTIMIMNTSLWNRALVDLILLIVTFVLIILIEYRFLRRPFLRLSAIVKRGWGILSLIPCSLLVLATAIALYPVYIAKNPSGIVLFYLLAPIIVIIYFTIFQNLYIQYQFQLSNHNMEILELQVDNLKEKLSENEEAAETARIERHDARHRFQTIACLLENNDSDAALAYIHAALEQLHEPDQMCYCSNPVLNAVLSSYLGQAKNEHIHLETHISIPDSLPVDDMEFSIVFANALENAITACRRLPKENRKIICRCIHKPRLMLKISNSYAGTVTFSEDGVPLSGETGHGIGTRSITAFCKKHDTFYNFTAENGWFTLTIAF